MFCFDGTSWSELPAGASYGWADLWVGGPQKVFLAGRHNGGYELVGGAFGPLRLPEPVAIESVFGVDNKVYFGAYTSPVICELTVPKP